MRVTPSIVALEDISPGCIVDSASHTVTREEIIAFAGQFDSQSMHLDDAAARDGVFGELVGSGWQTLAITMRLLIDAGLLGPSPIIGAEFAHMRFHRPMRPGDQLRASARLLQTRRSATRPDRGFVDLQVSTVNQAGDTLVEQTWTLLIPAREARPTGGPSDQNAMDSLALRLYNTGIAAGHPEDREQH